MRNRINCTILLLAALLVAPAAAAEERLCDVSWENCRVPLVALIDNEKVGIDVGVWFIKDARIPAALIRAAGRGVPIRMIMDPRANASYADNATFIAQMAAAGIRMRKRTAGDICHWKLMIFAGQNVVEFSGANFSPYAFVPTTPYIDYEDEVIKFSSVLTPSFMTTFDDIWTNTTDYANFANVNGPLIRNYPTYLVDPGLNFPPAQSYQNRLIPLIDAEPPGGQIDVDMYRVTMARPVDALIRAANRGVRIRFYGEPSEYRNPDRLTDSYNTDRLYIASLTYPGLIEMRMRQHLGSNHQKTVWLHSQHVSVFGTSNWSDASDDNQLEANFFSSEDFDPLQAIFNRKWYNQAPNGAIETVPFVPLNPEVPVPQTPANLTTGVPVANTKLKWNGGNWAWKYDIYFGDTPNPGLFAATGEIGTGVHSFALPTLLENRTYYWKIVSYTIAGKFKTGPIWSFTTGGAPPTDTTPPAVAITSPPSGATVSATVTLTASATDDVGVAGVRFLVDGVSLAAEDVAAPYSAVWDTRTTADGSHVLTAVARDAAGNVKTSAPVTVAILNGSAETGPACDTVTLDGSSKFVGSGEDNWTINVTAPSPSCAWTATSSDPSWLVVRSTFPTSPVGSGYVKVRALTNTGQKRSGYFTIGGRVYTVTQGAAGT